MSDATCATSGLSDPGNWWRRLKTLCNNFDVHDISRVNKLGANSIFHSGSFRNFQSDRKKGNKMYHPFCPANHDKRFAGYRVWRVNMLINER